MLLKLPLILICCVSISNLCKIFGKIWKLCPLSMICHTLQRIARQIIGGVLVAPSRGRRQHRQVRQRAPKNANLTLIRISYYPILRPVSNPGISSRRHHSSCAQLHLLTTPHRPCLLPHHPQPAECCL